VFGKAGDWGEKAAGTLYRKVMLFRHRRDSTAAGIEVSSVQGRSADERHTKSSERPFTLGEGILPRKTLADRREYQGTNIRWSSQIGLSPNRGGALELILRNRGLGKQTRKGKWEGRAS